MAIIMTSFNFQWVSRILLIKKGRMHLFSQVMEISCVTAILCFVSASDIKQIILHPS